MSRIFQNADFISSCSSESDNELSSDDDENGHSSNKSDLIAPSDNNQTLKKNKPQNVILKLYNREVQYLHIKRTYYFCQGH